MDQRRDLLSLQARACLLLLDKLIEDNEIFTLIKPAATAKKSSKLSAPAKHLHHVDTGSAGGDPETRRVTRGQLGKTFSRGANIRDSDDEEES